jgi:hypothetical protein
MDLFDTAYSSPTHGSKNQSLIQSLFNDPTNQREFLHQSHLWSRFDAEGETRYPGRSNIDFEHTSYSRTSSAKIHCLYGIPDNVEGRRTLGSSHPWARSNVYDLRNYTDANGWGPFRDDGSFYVDWEKIESIMLVLGYSSSICCRRFMTRFRPPWENALDDIVPTEKELLPAYPLQLIKEIDVPLELRDPYAVSGIYSRLVSFLGTCKSAFTPYLGPTGTGL